MDEQVIIEMWATVELMGHAQTAGRISRPSDWGGLLRVDVPEPSGEYRTEFYGLAAIYSVKLVSEEIARAFCTPRHQIISYDTPIVTREQHEAAMERAQQENSRLHGEIQELRRRLLAVDQPALLASIDPDQLNDA